MIDLAIVGTSGVTALHVLQQCAYRCFRVIRHGTVEWGRNATEQTFQKASVALNFSLMAYSGVYRKGFCLQGSYLLIGSNRASHQYHFMFTHSASSSIRPSNPVVFWILRQGWRCRWSEGNHGQ